MVLEGPDLPPQGTFPTSAVSIRIFLGELHFVIAEGTGRAVNHLDLPI